MTDREPLSTSLYRLTVSAQRFRWWIHVALYPLGWLTLYASSKIPPFDSLVHWIISGNSKLDSLGMEWAVSLHLAITRIHPVDEFFFINEWITWILFLSAFFILPQILFWSFRTRRKKLLLGIIVFIIVNLFSLYAHRFYCVWSFNQVSKLPPSLNSDDLLRQCGAPFCYRKSLNGKEEYWKGSYTDGYHIINVYFMDNGTAHINRAGGSWLD